MYSLLSIVALSWSTCAKCEVVIFPCPVLLVNQPHTFFYLTFIDTLYVNNLGLNVPGKYPFLRFDMFKGNEMISQHSQQQQKLYTDQPQH